MSRQRRISAATRGGLLLGLAAVLWARPVGGLAAQPVSHAGRPNVILVMTDDQGYGDLGCHGNTIVKTPALDRLYTESVRLTNFHVDPTCSPTRSALMTGRYSCRTGVWHTIMGRSLLRRDEVTMGDVFSAAGYRTGIFGKWHLGDNYPFRAADRGFAESLVHGGGGVGQTPDYWGNDYFETRTSTTASPSRATATAPTSCSTPRCGSSRPTATGRSWSTCPPTPPTGPTRWPNRTPGRTRRRACRRTWPSSTA